MKHRVTVVWSLGIAVSSLALAQSPTPGASTLLVPRELPGALDLLDPGSGLRLATVALDTAPRRVAVAPDGRLAAVLGCRETLSGSAAQVTVSIVALEEPRELRRFELGTMSCPPELTWPVAGRVILAPQAQGRAVVIDPDSGRVLRIPVVAQPAPGEGALRHAGVVDPTAAAVRHFLAEGGRLEDLAVSPVIPRAVCHACTPETSDF